MTRGGPLGSTCGLTYDADPEPPGVGDLLVSTGGSGYLILEAHQVRGQYFPHRWRFLCLRVDPTGDENIPPDARRFPLYWYPRKARA